MSRRWRRWVGIAVAVTGMWLVQRLLDPAPIPALSTLAGGLVAYAVWNTRASIARGVALGLILGSLVHAASHVTEGRADSLPGTLLHVAADAALGLTLGVLLLFAALAFDPAALRGSLAPTQARARRDV